MVGWFDKLFCVDGERPRSFLVLDGALGTCLGKSVQQLDPKLWSAGCIVSRPDLIQKTHLEYFNAGADIVTSSAYQVSYEGFHTTLSYSAEQTNAVLVSSTELARSAAKIYHGCSRCGKRMVAASIGCYGAVLADGSEYSGQYGKSVSQLEEWHKQRFAVLASTQPDILACETIPCLDEANALMNILAGVSTGGATFVSSNDTSTSSNTLTVPSCSDDITCGNKADKNASGIAVVPGADTGQAILFPEHGCLPTWLSIACQSSTELNSGESVESFVRTVEDRHAGSDSTALRHMAIGVNCTNPQFVESVLHTLRDCSSRSRILVAYPNRGDIWLEEYGSYKDGSGFTDEQFGIAAERWFAAGASIIGGCCQTSPSTIRSVKEHLCALV